MQRFLIIKKGDYNYLAWRKVPKEIRRLHNGKRWSGLKKIREKKIEFESE